MPDEKLVNSADELFERNKRLEGIFLPHARKIRDEAYDKSKNLPVRFVHYTSAESALKIINQKRLWMRNVACMSDYLEVQHGFTILWRFFSDKGKAKKFHDTVNLIAPGVAQEAITQFDQWWKLGTIRFNTFIASVSEHDIQEDFQGRLSMWRAFGPTTTARVGLVFNVSARSMGAEAMRLIFSPVAYFKDSEAEQLVLKAVENITANADFLKTVSRDEIKNWIFYMLLLGVTCVKHEGFHEEREWRVVHCPQLYPTPLIKSATETVGGVPQIVFKLPLDKSVDPILDDLDFSKLFDRLIIGPSPYPMAMLGAFNSALSDAGVTEAGKKIFISNIPIRT